MNSAAPAQNPGTTPAPASAPPPAIALHGVDKSFGAVHANVDVSLSIARGTIHGIVGENGAGKSTLMNILYGYYQADRGEIRVGGQLVDMKSSQQAIALGIGMVHQHFMLVDDFTVLENVVLGSETQVRLAPTLLAARSHLQEMAGQYQMGVNPDARISTLSVGQQQRVEVLKALYRGAEILILDEPTAVLTPEETDHLFRILLSLKAQGKTIVLITHKLREILEFTDVVTVMRGGRIIDTVATSSTDSAKLAEMMVGRSVLQANRERKTEVASGAPLLAVKDLNLLGERGEPLLSNINLEVHAGEIVGIAGVAGNGQSELLEILAGMQSASNGSIRLRGQEISQGAGKINPRQPLAAQYRELGVAHVPEDRLKSGVVKSFSCAENAILGSQRERGLNRRGLLSLPAIGARITSYIKRFDIRPPAPDMRISLLSGGNQQKLVLAREIERDAEVYLIGQPTRGVDIGAIEMIHQTLLELRDAGKAIILVSVELDEIMALSDRIVVMCGGRITGNIAANQAERATLGMMMGGKSA
jgi:simple sugar transport system ATP-binding protein